MEGAILTFPKDAQFQCTVIDKQPRKFCPWSWCSWLSKSKKCFDLGEILKGCIEENPDGNEFIAKINGHYKWVETQRITDVKSPKPL